METEDSQSSDTETPLRDHSFHEGLVDECAAGTHGCHVHADCTDLPGSFRCECRASFEGSGEHCHDVDECATDNGGSAQQCINQVGRALCACQAGLVLEPNGRSARP